MNHYWRRLLALLLSLTTVLSLLPAGFALESAEEPDASQEIADSAELPEDSADAQTPDQPEDSDDAQTPDQPEDSDDAQTPDDTNGTDSDAETPDQPENSDDTPEADQPLPDDEEDEEDADNPPQQEVPAPSAGSYDKLTLEGTWDYDAAFDVQELLSDALVADGASYAVMDKTVLSCAMTRAAELAVRFNQARPSGEAWSTVLGDAGIKATVYTQAISAGEESPEQISDLWGNDSGIMSLLSSDSCKGIGIGCFSQPGGTRYWVLIVTNVLTEPVTREENVTGTATVDYQIGYLGDAMLTLPKTTLDVGETAQASFAIANGSDCFVPTADMISYSSSSAAVTVDSKGCLTANSAGSATITAALSGTDKRDSVEVTAQLNLTTVPLSQIANQNGSVKLTWKSVSGATHYQVWRKLSGGKWEKLGDPVTGTSYTDSSVTSGNTYVYTVRALYVVNGKVKAQGSYDTAGLTTLYLSTPKLTSASGSSTGVTFKWQSVTGAETYDVYRKTDKTSWVKLGNVKSTSYLDSNVTANTQYYYTVRAKSGGYQSYYITKGISVTATATVKTQVYVTRSEVNYRTGASTSAKIAGRFSAGTSVNVIEGWSTTANGATWYMINRNGTIYYVQASYLMATPEITQLSNHTAGLKVTWSKVSNANGYYLYWRNSSGSWTRLASISSNGTTSYVVPDSKLTSGQSYTFTVRAYYDKVLSYYDHTGWSATYLKAPKLTSAVSNDKDTITVTWESVAGAQSYALYRKTDGTNWTKIATVKSGSTTSYKDTSVTTLTTYTYTVRASSGKLLSSYDATGVSAVVIPSDKLTPYVVTSEVKYRTGPGTSYSSPGTLKAGTTVQVISGWSKTANGYTWFQIKLNNAIQYVASEFLLGTPKLDSIAAKNGGITITWSKVSNATGYVLYRKTADSDWGRIANLKSSVLSYTDDSLSSGTTYTYTVRAAYNSIQSRYDTNGLSLCYLTTPQLTSTASSDKGITINWSRVTGAQGYYVYRKLDGGNWSKIAQVNSGSTLSYQDSTNLIKGFTYYYTVRAFSGSSWSDFQSPGLSAKATATLNPTTKDYVTTGQLNYRDKPGTGSDSTVKGTLKEGTTVKVIPDGTTKVGDSTWYMIWLNGNTYYASAKYLKEK